MKQRLHVARTLLHDPVGAREFRNVIKNLQSEKKTIPPTTHYMSEADFLCQKIAGDGVIAALAPTPTSVYCGKR
jgi:ABC-type multidrug transport system ATPase subunit